ncbi:carboxypeptidase [Cryptosporidium canis]|uniref:Carboxypeptidase n=1 Tax=Cryptosporidium canis TaxID=195482 RepID=A0A9D5DEL3_9CRYT|nr:carboxypeptidase [Cryptosporidium canis]
MSRAFGRVMEPERGLHATGEQISTMPDDYLELKTQDIDLGIENQDLRRILYSLNRGSLRNFPTLSEAAIIMDNLASQFGASYIKRYIIGKSYEGRPIEAYRIGFFGKENDTASEDSYPNIKSGDKPAFLLTSMHHSREPAGLTTGIYFVSKLLEDAVYKQDPASYFLLSNIEIWYVPFVNPDGYAAIERTRNFGIRKNQRKTCNSGRSDEDGVDINRNYDYGFDNSLISKCDPQEYSGEYPFSEPETRAIRDLVVNVKNFKTAVNLHTFGDLWTIPWNCCKNKDLSERVANIYNELRYEILISSPSCILRTLFHLKGPFFINSVTKGFSTSFFTKSRHEFENISKYCFSSAARNPIMDYEASGEADDYLLGVHNIISLSPEIGSDYFGFYPPQSEIFPVAKKYYSQILAVASKSTIELSISSALHIQKYDTLGNRRLDLSLFNSGLSTVCSKKNAPPQNANKTNDGCHSVLAWELLTSNCEQFSEFDPGNTLFGNYSAGFRYRSSNLKDWSSLVNNTDDCNTRQLLISFNKKNNKEQGREDFQFIKGFTFSGSIEPRSSRGFKLKFRYKNPLNVVPFDLNQNSNIIIHACFAIFKSEYTDNICQCGFIKFPNGNSHSNTALIVQSTSSDHLCGHLHANKNEFLPYSDPVEEYSGRRDIIFLSREAAYTAINLMYVLMCIIIVTVVTAISILYSIVYKKYYINSVKTVNNHIVPVVSEALSKA